ncbi:OsmC family protein [Xanthomonas sp. NCPPB 1068]|uniref:OsmC family protein n=1 Tax=Xanthomonas sp. NCPPB 1068 TaxID=487525 RepID=UPI003555F86F
MSGQAHHYTAQITWTGDRGEGTGSYRGYGREHEIAIAGKPTLAGSSDPAFRGDASRHNPEDLLVASLSACHMLWYLHLAAEAGVVVRGYIDEASGTMLTDAGRGQFSEVVLRPVVTISAGDPVAAEALHHGAHAACFIARSVNFPVRCEPSIVVAA